jgi:hypothetical protein
VTKQLKSFRDFFSDKHGNLTIAQNPNPALLGWFIFLVLGNLLHSANLKWLSTTFLFAWAFMELYKGDSYFRRLLGFVVLLYIIFKHFAG